MTVTADQVRSAIGEINRFDVFADMPHDEQIGHIWKYLFRREPTDLDKATVDHSVIERELRRRGQPADTQNRPKAPEWRETSWLPVDLKRALAGIGTDPPDLLKRSDDIHLIYPGRIHWASGESESLKSWFAQLAAYQSISAYQHVLYIDFEDEAKGVVERLRALGADTETIENWFHYIRPDEPLTDHQGRATWCQVQLEHTLKNLDFDLAVIDGVTEAMSLEGLNPYDNGDVARWIAMLPRRLSMTGAGVIVIDHVTKNKETRGRFAIGGQHKLAGIDGVAYGFECRRPLSRALVEPITGLATITVHKDRPGHVRPYCREGIAGTLTLTSYPDGGVTGTIESPSSLSSAPDPILRAKILAAVKVYDGCSKSHLESSITGYAVAIRAATAWLVEQEQLEVRKEGVAHRHYITDKGKAALEGLDSDEVRS